MRLVSEKTTMLDEAIKEAITNIATLNGHSVIYTNASTFEDMHIRCSNCGYWLYACLDEDENIHKFTHLTFHPCQRHNGEAQPMSLAFLEAFDLEVVTSSIVVTYTRKRHAG